MKLARNWSVVVAMLLVGFTSRPVLAISPSAVMVYGEKLGQPILLGPASPAEFPAFGLVVVESGAYANPDRTAQAEAGMLTPRGIGRTRKSRSTGARYDPVNAILNTPASTGVSICRRHRNRPSSFRRLQTCRRNRIPFPKNLVGLPLSGLWAHRNSPR